MPGGDARRDETLGGKRGRHSAHAPGFTIRTRAGVDCVRESMLPRRNVHRSAVCGWELTMTNETVSRQLEGPRDRGVFRDRARKPPLREGEGVRMG